MAQDWDIRPRSDACTACKCIFEDKQSYFSALLRGDDGYERGDFCPDCWKTKEGELTPYSAWSGIYRKPPEDPNAEPLKKETAESLLRKLIEDEDAENVSVIYILSVMLERKKAFKERDVTIDDDGSVHRVYEHRQTGETFIILDPQLKLDTLGDVQLRVIEMLGGPLPQSTENDGETNCETEEEKTNKTDEEEDMRNNDEFNNDDENDEEEVEDGDEGLDFDDDDNDFEEDDEDDDDDED